MSIKVKLTSEITELLRDGVVALQTMAEHISGVDADAEDDVEDDTEDKHRSVYREVARLQGALRQAEQSVRDRTRERDQNRTMANDKENALATAVKKLREEQVEHEKLKVSYFHCFNRMDALEKAMRAFASEVDKFSQQRGTLPQRMHAEANRSNTGYTPITEPSLKAPTPASLAFNSGGWAR